ncbi:hypothetical protein FACS1894110_15110 [Spirochaetia bacterium]|nr:hypothetical protein FACS1894110_15110 [Spirochaetia bacterium]
MGTLTVENQTNVDKIVKIEAKKTVTCPDGGIQNGNKSNPIPLQSGHYTVEITAEGPDGAKHACKDIDIYNDDRLMPVTTQDFDR